MLLVHLTTPLTCVVIGDDEPLVSHATDTDITVLKKDSLIISTVSRLILLVDHHTI